MTLRNMGFWAGLCLVSTLACANSSTPVAAPDAAAPLSAEVRQRIEQDLVRREYHASASERG